MPLHALIGTILMILGAITIAIGILGLYRFYDFYSRAALSSVIDSAGFLLVMLGIIVYEGLTTFSLKVGIIIFFMVLLNPISNHMIVRGAHMSGHDSKGA